MKQKNNCIYKKWLKKQAAVTVGKYLQKQKNEYIATRILTYGNYLGNSLVILQNGKH